MESRAEAPAVWAQPAALTWPALVAELRRHANAVTSLDLRQCPRFDSLKLLEAVQPLQYLTELYADAVPLTAKDLSSLWTRCPRLARLTFTLLATDDEETWLADEVFHHHVDQLTHLKVTWFSWFSGWCTVLKLFQSVLP